MNRAILLILTGGLAMGLFGCSKKGDSNQNLSWQEQISAKTLTEDQFSKIYKRAILEKISDAEVEVTGSLELTLHIQDSKATLWLGNAWSECCDQPNIRVETCSYYIDSLLSTFTAEYDPIDNLDPNLILPEIKCKEYLDGIPLQADGTHPAYSRHIAGDIYLTYVLNLENKYYTLSESDLLQANLLNDQLYYTAISNLKKLSPKLQLLGKPPFFMIVSDDANVSSVLLFDGIWEQQKEHITGEVVACVPSRDYLLFTGSQNPEGISGLRKLAKEISENESYLISETLLIRVDGQWQVYED